MTDQTNNFRMKMPDSWTQLMLWGVGSILLAASSKVIVEPNDREIVSRLDAVVESVDMLVAAHEEDLERERIQAVIDRRLGLEAEGT